MALTVLLVIVGYILGSFPTAYLAVRALKRQDIRAFGSGSVSGSNVREAAGLWPGIMVGVVDILKGAGAVWIAQAFDRSLAQQLAVGLAAVAGHNWSIFLGFHGGRGLATMVGVLLAAMRLELLLFIIIALLGYTVTGNVPLWLGISTALLPFWAYALEEKAPVIWANVALVVLVVLKRLTANFEPLPQQGKMAVFMYRLLLDRDTRDRESWVRRRGSREEAPIVPTAEADAPSGHLPRDAE